MQKYPVVNRSIHIIQLLFGGGILLLLLTGCIRENRDNCPPETAVRSVVLKVMDPVTGRHGEENGGDGVARDIIEQTMKAQGHWMGDEAFGW